ncbi:MAG: sigma-70 family RNA polymerase sigma factor [Anaerolineae bacterium]|nr:sigma-70 family RNA polymerase sigma factor [Anaerolineae bacterium]
MSQKTNEAWLSELRGPESAKALSDLHALLLRGMGYALRRYDVTEQDVEDFVQEAQLKILDNLDRFRGESRFTTWAHKIGIRVALTELRRRRWRDVSLQDLESPFEDEGDFTPAILTHPAPSPEDQVTQQTLMALIFKLIQESLTDRQREAITAAVIHGMPLDELARKMNTKRNALYKLIYDARQRLKREVMDQGLSPEDILAVFES